MTTFTQLQLRVTWNCPSCQKDCCVTLFAQEELYLRSDAVMCLAHKHVERLIQSEKVAIGLHTRGNALLIGSFVLWFMLCSSCFFEKHCAHTANRQ